MIYLDQAATSYPKIQPVKDAVNQAMDIAGNANRSMDLSSSRLIYKTRQSVADYFSVSDFRHVIFNSGNTESLNTCIYGILKKGDHVITTYAEHNSVLRPLYDLEEKGRIQLTICAPYLEDIQKNILTNTRIVIVSHSSNVTGEIYDVDAIGKFVQSKNIIMMVDAAQSAGHIPVSMKNIDVLCFSGHKGLLGVCGIGGICLKKPIDISCLKVGGTGFDSMNKKQPTSYPEHLEAGTMSLLGIASLRAGVQYVMEHQKDIEIKEYNLMKRLYSKIENMHNLVVYSTLFNSTPIFAFNIKGMDNAKVANLLLDKYGIVTRCKMHCAPLMHMHLKSDGLVRASFSFLNTEEEIDLFVQALKELCGE